MGLTARYRRRAQPTTHEPELYARLNWFVTRVRDYGCVRQHVATYPSVMREQKELTLYPHHYNYDLAQTHLADLREELAQHRLARQVRMARGGPVQPRPRRFAALLQLGRARLGALWHDWTARPPTADEVEGRAT
jgi:hypothetical protein